MRYCDELDFGFGWIDDGGPVRRTSHALVSEGRRLARSTRSPGRTPSSAPRARRGRGVLQLLDRHGRDSRRLADDSAAHHVPDRRIAGAPFEFLPVAHRCLARGRALVAGAARARLRRRGRHAQLLPRAGRRLGVHPLLRLRPPRSLRRVYPRHVLTGHGEGVHEDATQALHAALQTARRPSPGGLVDGLAARRLLALAARRSDHALDRVDEPWRHGLAAAEALVRAPRLARGGGRCVSSGRRRSRSRARAARPGPCRRPRGSRRS